VGYSWIDSLKAHAEKHVTDQQLANAKFRFPYNTPGTKEAYHYREMFERHYPQAWAAECVPGGPSVACSTAAALEWDPSLKNVVDPSGRSVQAVHNAAYA
jgi:asparagine synthase (glutamine-hydrolysing)